MRQLLSMNETKKKSTLNRSAAILRVVTLSKFSFLSFFFAFVFCFCFEIEPTMAHCGNTAPCPALCCKKRNGIVKEETEGRIFTFFVFTEEFRRSAEKCVVFFFVF